VTFFSPTASWNRKASELGRAVGYDEYVYRFQMYGGGINQPAFQKTKVMFKDLTTPIYPASEADYIDKKGVKRRMTAKAYQAKWAADNGQPFIASIGKDFPWNPAWKPSPGNDASMIIIDEPTEEVWELWKVEPNIINGLLVWFNIFAGIWNPVGDKVVMGSMNYYRNLRTGTDGSVTSIARGMGTHKLVPGPVLADEVLNGKIPHALSMLRADTMFGPEKANPFFGNSDPGAGKTKTFAMKPATRSEMLNPAFFKFAGINIEPTELNRSKTIPDGMRMALDISDSEIEAWLNSRGYTGALRDTARVFAVALRDYGWIFADTCAAYSLIETEGITNPVARAKWAKAGIVDVTGRVEQPFSDLIDGLLYRGRIYVVAAPA